jgi:heme-degrading monooxygenase HmoA
MTQMTFINALSVPNGKEDEFVAKWDEGAEYVRSCAGFISTSLHRSMTADSRFRFFTVAEWESADHFRAAVSSAWWQEYVARFGFGNRSDDFGAVPTLCERVR